MDDRVRVSAMWELERAAMQEGCKLVAGVDEAGRGPLAGPVCAAAVILPPDAYFEKLNDSKVLTEKQRQPPVRRNPQARAGLSRRAGFQ